MELTNLVVNPTARNIMQQFGTDIEKARSGVYADTAENRKLHRVGQQYGGKKQEEEGHGKPKGKEDEPKGKQPKDERFSEDGIVGKDGGFNKQGKTYKRWAALREKVESGKATPEEKKEFAHLHNQYLNEKDRHNYEQSKQTDPKAKEPKYKTVDERREEYKAKSGKGTEQKENEEKKTVSPAAKKLLKDDDHKMAIYISNFRTNTVLSYSKKLSELQADGVSYDSPAYKRAAVKEITEGLSHSDKFRIAEAADKYGPDVLKEAMVAEKGNAVENTKDTGMTDIIAEGIILDAVQYRDSTKRMWLANGARAFARNYVNSLNHSDDGSYNDDYLKLRKQGFTDAEIRPEVERLVAQDLKDYISPNEVKPFVDEIWDNLDMPAIERELKKKK